MRQWQHIIPSGAIAALGLWVCYVSFTQKPTQAFLFPRLISSVFVVLWVHEGVWECDISWDVQWHFCVVGI